MILTLYKFSPEANNYLNKAYFIIHVYFIVTIINMVAVRYQFVFLTIFRISIKITAFGTTMSTYFAVFVYNIL